MKPVPSDHDHDLVSRVSTVINQGWNQTKSGACNVKQSLTDTVKEWYGDHWFGKHCSDTVAMLSINAYIAPPIHVYLFGMDPGASWRAYSESAIALAAFLSTAVEIGKHAMHRILKYDDTHTPKEKMQRADIAYYVGTTVVGSMGMALWEYARQVPGAGVDSVGDIMWTSAALTFASAVSFVVMGRTNFTDRYREMWGIGTDEPDDDALPEQTSAGPRSAEPARRFWRLPEYLQAESPIARKALATLHAVAASGAIILFYHAHGTGPWAENREVTPVKSPVPVVQSVYRSVYETSARQGRGAFALIDTAAAAQDSLQARSPLP